MQKIHTTAHHPEGNGVVERVNGTLVKQLALVVNDEQDNWSELLPVVMFAYHTSYHRSIDTTPFEAMFGRRALMPLDIEHYTTPEIRNPDVMEQLSRYRQKIEWVQDHVAESNRKAQRRSKERYDRRATNKTFQPDDEVLLKIMKHKKGTCPKLSDKYAGPYTVVTQISEVNYRIKDQITGREQTVHANRMKLLPALTDPVKISKKEFEELFGDRDDEEEEFLGFEDPSNEIEYAGIVGSTYMVYEIDVEE